MARDGPFGPYLILVLVDPAELDVVTEDSKVEVIVLLKSGSTESTNDIRFDRSNVGGDETAPGPLPDSKLALGLEF